MWIKKNYKTERHPPSLFIDSILRGLPIPPITIYKDASAREEGQLIDGQQRIKTLAWFVNGELEGQSRVFKLFGEGIADKWIGKDFRGLEEINLKDFLLRAYIPVTFIRQLNDETPPLPNASSLYVLFDRLNSGGQALHPHEKRSVLTITNKSNAVLDKFLHTVYTMSQWRDIFKFINIHKKPETITQYRELIFRFYAFLLYKDNYNGNLAKFLDSFALNYNMTQEECNNLIKYTEKVFKLVKKINLDKNLFTPKKYFNTAFYEVFMVTLMKKVMEDKTYTDKQLLKIYNIFIERNIYDPTGRSSKAKTIVNRIYDDASIIFDEE